MIIYNDYSESCINCRKKYLKPFYTILDKGVEVKYAICRFCGLIFQNPSLQEDYLDYFYKEVYRQSYTGSDLPNNSEKIRQVERADYYVSVLKSEVNKINSHLDFGCSTGTFLKKISEQFDVKQSIGIELGDGYRRSAKKSGLEVYKNLDDLSSKHLNIKFDFISICHVLEHINNPIKFLQTIARNFLSENGILFIEVPNIRGACSLEVPHSICFSEKTLIDTVNMAGLKVVFKHFHGYPKFKSPSAKNHLFTLVEKDKDLLNKVPKASRLFINTSKIKMLKGMIPEDSWIKFLVKYPYYLRMGYFNIVS